MKPTIEGANGNSWPYYIRSIVICPTVHCVGLSAAGHCVGLSAAVHCVGLSAAVHCVGLSGVKGKAVYVLQSCTVVRIIPKRRQR